MKLFKKNKKLNMAGGDAAFIIPFWSEGNKERYEFLNDAIESIMCQTDKRFHIYIIDDNSPSIEVKKYLSDFEQSNSKITIIYAKENKGPGAARNLGIRQAYADNCPFICFLDADDMSHPNRVAATRKLLLENEEIDVVYSAFQVIDERKNNVERDNLIEGVKIILSDMEKRPLYGYDSWKTIAKERDNLTIPSALNVRVELAYAVQFPEHVRFHEDTYTWLRYAGIGGYVFYLDSIPSKYRIKQNAKGSESRERSGGIEEFNRMRCEIIMQGLEQAMNYAEKRGQVENEQKEDYKIMYLLNVASLIENEGTENVSSELICWAKQINNEKFNSYRKLYFGD